MNSVGLSSGVVPRLKASVKRTLPEGLVRTIRDLRHRARFHNTRMRWAAATGDPVYLGRAELEELQAKHPFRTSYSYNPESLLRRGEERAEAILALPGAREAQSFLEIACSDGMVCAALQRAGKTTVAIDRDGEDFDPRASEAGTKLLRMDGEQLDFPDSGFDYAFSYNSFEHFRRPERVLGEMTRVVRPGGYIYVEFGPLYNSAWGEHAYRTITAPYCQFLFPKALMNEYAREHGLNEIDFEHVNGWSLEQYRELWKSFGEKLETVRYEETRDRSSVDMIGAHLECFRKRVPSFDNFIVSNITALFRKKP